MTLTTHILGYPRIGAKRELKFAEESYWKGEITQAEFLAKAQALEASNWQAQINAGLSLVTVGDFVFYDSILTHAVRLGVIPARFKEAEKLNQVDQQFYLARGRAPHCTDVAALEMTKWFDTNYHYLVPEYHPDTRFSLHSNRLLAEVAEAKAQGHNVKVVLVGPVSLLWLGKEKDAGFDR